MRESPGRPGPPFDPAGSSAASIQDPLDPALRSRLQTLCEEGWEIWRLFDVEKRQDAFHPFVASDYPAVLETLISLRAPGLRFLEWGSASGVITIMADLLGFEACGIELDADLVAGARALARRSGSGATFATGSFLPAGYRWRHSDGDARLGTIGDGESGYQALGRPLDDFHVVFGYPWDGEEAMMLDLMQVHGRPDARLVIHASHGITVRSRRQGTRRWDVDGG